MHNYFLDNLFAISYGKVNIINYHLSLIPMHLNKYLPTAKNSNILFYFHS